MFKLFCQRGRISGGEVQLDWIPIGEFATLAELNLAYSRGGWALGYRATDSAGRELELVETTDPADSDYVLSAFHPIPV